MNSDGATTVEWVANAPRFWCWAEWEEEETCALFHQGSGETLLLNPLGRFVLKAVSDRPMTAQALTSLAAARFQLPEDEALAAAIGVSLASFRQRGLVLPVEP